MTAPKAALVANGGWCYRPYTDDPAHFFPQAANYPGSLLMTALCMRRFHSRVRLPDGDRRRRCSDCRDALKEAASS